MKQNNTWVVHGHVCAPTIDAIENTFADKTNDSRYDGTFTTVYRGNWDLSWEQVLINKPCIMQTAYRLTRVMQS